MSIGMTVHGRLTHFRATGGRIQRQCGPHAFGRHLFASPKFGHTHTSQSLRSGHVQAALSGVALHRVRSRGHMRVVVSPEVEAVFISEGVFSELPPNKRLNRTAHQRCWWVPVALCAPAAG